MLLIINLRSYGQDIRGIKIGEEIFNVSEIRKDSKALCIAKIKINTDKVRLRSVTSVST